jgi:hypothetical protein
MPVNVPSLSEVRGLAFAFALVGCAQANPGTPDATGGGSAHPDAGCGDTCDADHDGVVDGSDQCPNTSSIEIVNSAGCADSQLTATLQPFPPFNLTWTPTGDLGRAEGLTWTYVGIERKDLFHIDWIICDDPATPCGLSLDGPIDNVDEHWTFSAADSDLPAGKIVFTNTTHILLDDMSTPQLAGRLTVTITDDNGPVAGADVGTLHVTPRDGSHGAEIKNTGFVVVAKAELQAMGTSTWTPYLDYYDSAPTPTTGMDGVVTSFGGSFYAK